MTNASGTRHWGSPMNDERIRTMIARTLGDLETEHADALDATRKRIRRRAARRKAYTVTTAGLVSIASLLFVFAALRQNTAFRNNREAGTSGQPSRVNYPQPVEGVSAIPLSALVAPEGPPMLQLTFPDGTEATMEFPNGVHMAGLGVRGSTVGSLTGDGGCCERPIDLYYGSPEDTGLLSGQVLETYRGAGGAEVRLEAGDPQSGAELYLVYRFGPWTALVYDTSGSMSSEERRRWAIGLSATVQERGLITLHGSEDLTLAEPGYPTGPALFIVGPSHEPELFIYPTVCQPTNNVSISEIAPQKSGRSTFDATWCPREGGFRVTATSQTQELVRAVIDGLILT
jgi:hypothetical protein